MITLLLCLLVLFVGIALGLMFGRIVPQDVNVRIEVIHHGENSDDSADNWKRGGG